jgi:spore germination protein YaaH
MVLIKRIFLHLLVLIIGFLIIANSFPIFAFAASSDDLTVSGWIPYWNDSKGIKDAKKHIKKLDTVYPFSFVAQENGTIKDLAGMDSREWRNFTKYAHSKKVEVIPTVMWSDGGSIHANLSYKSLRTKHIDNIVSMVEDGDFDGVDIDYEGKLSSTKDYYSQFLKELKDELGDKVLTCTVEARTPADSLYNVVPPVILYANDFSAIGKYCDRVEIMAYDQQRADLRLDAARKGEPYMPVSDPEWVEKVIKLALKEIPADKIILGVPTYGHHYQVTVAPEWYSDYSRIGALNVPDILDIAKEYKVTPGRNKAGEMSFSYFPNSSVYRALNALPTPRGTTQGNEAAAKALLYANATGQSVKVNLAWYSDATAIEDKIDLAKKYDLAGVALFKIDGEEDQNIWKLF